MIWRCPHQLETKLCSSTRDKKRKLECKENSLSLYQQFILHVENNKQGAPYLRHSVGRIFHISWLQIFAKIKRDISCEINIPSLFKGRLSLFQVSDRNCFFNLQCPVQRMQHHVHLYMFFYIYASLIAKEGTAIYSSDIVPQRVGHGVVKKMYIWYEAACQYFVGCSQYLLQNTYLFKLKIFAVRYCEASLTLQKKKGIKTTFVESTLTCYFPWEKKSRSSFISKEEISKFSDKKMTRVFIKCCSLQRVIRHGLVSIKS